MFILERKGGAANLKRNVRAVLLILFSAILLFSAWKVFDILRTYHVSQNAYDDLDRFVQVDPTTALPAESPAAGETPTPQNGISGAADPVNWPRVDFDELKAINPDVVGWIVIEGTNINYPILQGVDNDYYLNHLPDGTANRAGSIMLDAGNQQGWCDDLNVVHGHRMRTGDMFGSLHLFGKADYAMEHLNMILYTPGGDYRIELIAACTVDGKRLGFPANFQDDAAFEAYVGQLVRSSAYKAGWLPEREDRLILLSTCAYVYDNARFVLLGRLAPLTAETSPVQ